MKKLILKTLKDLKIFKWNDEEYENMDITNEEYSNGKEGRLLREDSVRLSDLKAEAVKWVKEYMDNEIEEFQIGDWMLFFNLTEEDLK